MMGLKPFLVLAVGVPLILGGCATRESVRNAQDTANLAEMHANAAKAQADEATSIGNSATGAAQNAMGAAQTAQQTAQTAQQRTDQLAADLKTVNARISTLAKRVVYKPVKHRKPRRRIRHHVVKPADTALKPSGS
jgi:hypothetical protein